MTMNQAAIDRLADTFEQKVLEGLLNAVDADTPEDGKVTADMIKLMLPATRLALSKYHDRGRAIHAVVKASTALITLAAGWTGKKERTSIEMFSVLMLVLSEIGEPVAAAGEQTKFSTEFHVRNGEMLAQLDCVPDEWLDALFNIAAVALTIRKGNNPTEGET